MKQLKSVAGVASGSGSDLYAGGDFWSAGYSTVRSVAKWDGTAWRAR